MLEGFFCILADRCKLACIRDDGIQKTRGSLETLLSFFSLLCQGPRSSGRGMPNKMRPNPNEEGNAGGQIPACQGMAESQSPPPQDDGTLNPLHTPLQAMLPVPPVKKPYEWHTTPPLQALPGHFKRSIVLAKH